MLWKSKLYKKALEVIRQAGRNASMSLDLISLKVKSLPPEIGKLTNLTTLALDNNLLSSLPPAIWKLTNLTTLRLRSNRLTSLPPTIWKLNNLATLRLRSNRLTSLPPEIGKLTNLTTLNLDSNRLTSLPPEIGKLYNLTTLNLDSNRLTSLPPGFGNLTNLTKLALDRNTLTSLPPEIGKLTNLKTLRLSTNRLTSLPPVIGKLTNLTVLDLRENKVPSLPPEIWKLTNLTVLDLSLSELTSLPPTIGKLTNLTTLRLDSNRLTSLPPEIGKLTNLRVLDIRENKLTSLPSEIRKLTNLRVLDISGNKVTSLPPEISKLTNLTLLNIRENKVTSLSQEIGKLTNLTTVNLSVNEVTSLPPEIGKLTNLTTLNLDSNRLTSLPPEIGKLYNLTTLNLDRNRLTSLPPEIGNLTNLTKLALDSNPLEIPPIEIAIHGIDAVRTYFEEIQKEASKLFEAKLLIVGQGGVGKTHLMNRLIHDKVDPRITGTEGIDISRWLIKTKQTDNFRINCWDFAGQEINHATHQFFLTKRSLYLFVWEARTDADLLSFDYWLNTVKVLSDNSPVIVIQNKIDAWKKPINQEGWKKKFPNIVEYQDVSALKATGIDALKNSIIRQIEKLPHIGDVLPKRWMDIRQRLEGLNENYIPYSDYQEICVEFGMNDEQTELLSGYYHDLGVFLRFKDNSILRNTIFLKPGWATTAVYKVTDNKQVKDNFGKFRFSELQNIWTDKNEFPLDKHVDLVELMKSFKLCFELPMGQGYIIPELLRANQPQFDWNYENNLRFKYKYDFMPAGVMARFIVLTHDLIKSNLYWKDGVVLAWENTEALVIKTDSRVIEMRICGDDKISLLHMLRRDMGHIHSPFHNLEVNEMVPCICDECQKDPAPYFYPYQNLRKAREKNKDTIECQKSFSPVSIEELLGGIENKTPERQATRPQDIKLFLASSSELEAERKKIESFIRKENDRLHDQNIFLKLVIWEDLKQSFHGKRIQDYFNEKLLECDIVLCLFFKKVGAFTKEEFDVAYQHFKENGKPRHLYVFFKSANVNTREIDKSIVKLIELQDEIAEAEQIYKWFKSEEDLILQLRDQLVLIIPEMGY